MYRTENNNIIKDICDIKLTKLFYDIVMSITEDIGGWQKEYIFKDDDRIHTTANSNKGHAILMEKKIWKEATKNKKIDLKELDLAAFLKLLDKRLFNSEDYCYSKKIIKSNIKPESFIEIINFISNDFRKINAHTSISNHEKIAINNKRIHNKLEQMKTKLEKVCDDCYNYLRKGLDVKNILSNFIEKSLVPMIDAYYMAKIGDDISYDIVRDINTKDLATYNVIVDHTVLLQKDGFFAIGTLVEDGKCIFAEQTMLDKLKKIQMQGETSDKDKVKEIIEKLVVWIDDNDKKPKLILLKNANVIDKLSEAIEAKWCVLTLDVALANDIWNLQKKNVIVLKPKKRATFEIFEKDVDSTFDNQNTNDRFKVEVVLGNKETSLDETIHMVQTACEDDEVNDIAKDIRFKEYEEDYKFDNENIPEKGMRVYFGVPVDSGSYKLSKCVSEGGEGKIYEYDDDETSYAKIYKKSQLTPLKARKIEAMVARKEDFANTNICMPQDVLCHPRYRENKIIVGYSMKKASREGKRTLGTIRQVVMSIVKGEKEYSKWERKDLVLICYNCSLLFETLHKKDFWMGDVNPDNIMVDEDKKVYFIDTDSYQFDEFSCPVGTVEFSSPELLKKMDEDKLSYDDVKRTPDDEFFALAVLYFYILFLSEFPYNINTDMGAKECILKHNFRFKKEKKNGKEIKRNYIWKNLTEELKNMFFCNFAETKRYTDAEWTKAFNNMLRMSDNIPGTTYVRELSNEIFPYSAIENVGEVWETRECTSCYKEFKIARMVEEPVKSHEKECPACKEIKKLLQKRIYKLVCPKCKELWTVNEWDIDGKDIDKLYCPDCDDKFYFSRKAEFEEKEAEGVFNENIERQMSFALRKYKEELT